MKKQIIKITLTVLLLAVNLNVKTQNIGINTTGALADSSALLDLSSNDKGFLITRADTANINNPAFGLMTLSPADTCLYIYNGIHWMGLGGGGKNCPCNSICAQIPSPPSMTTCGGTTTLIIDVTSLTGKEWMDRNIGASQVATAFNDYQAYGSLYQWGRLSDGHECINWTGPTSGSPVNGTTSTLSSSDNPGHNNFITTGSPYDWRSPQNNNLWQGVNGINNPCPNGYRLPTSAEWSAERSSWISSNAAGAFASPLKLTGAGERYFSNGALQSAGSDGLYWASTDVGNGNSYYIYINTNASAVGGHLRAYAHAVRCIKD